MIFDHHADFAAGVDVVADQAFGGFALGLLLRRGLALCAQDVDGLLDVAAGFHQCRAAIAESRAGALAQIPSPTARDVRLPQVWWSSLR